MSSVSDVCCNALISGFPAVPCHGPSCRCTNTVVRQDSWTYYLGLLPLRVLAPRSQPAGGGDGTHGLDSSVASYGMAIRHGEGVLRSINAGICGMIQTSGIVRRQPTPL
jgi:hypothetical protein